MFQRRQNTLLVLLVTGDDQPYAGGAHIRTQVHLIDGHSIQSRILQLEGKHLPQFHAEAFGDSQFTAFIHRQQASMPV